MKNSNPVSSAETRRGSALIALIAILVLAGVIYGIQWWIKSKTPDPDTVMDLAPWKEWRIREESEKPIPPLRAE
jgi:hypothetical protein